MEQVGSHLRNKALSCIVKDKHRKAQCYLNMAIICYSSLYQSQPIKTIINELYYKMGLSYLKCLDYPLGLHYYSYVLRLCPPIFQGNKQMYHDTNIHHKTVLVYSRFSDDYLLLMCRFLPKFNEINPFTEIIVTIPHSLFSIMSRIPFMQKFKCIRDGEHVNYDYHLEVSTLPSYANIQTAYDTQYLYLPYVRHDNEIYEKQNKMIRTYVNRENKIVLMNLMYSREIEMKQQIPIDEKYIQNLTDDFKNINFLTLTQMSYNVNNTLVDTSIINYEKIVAYISLADIVVTRCSVVAHLAGCMNRRVFLILEKHHDWIWSNTYWYNQFTIFKQSDDNTWDDVFYNLKKTLQDYI